MYADLVLLSLLTGPALIFDGSSVLALAAVTLLVAATIWTAYRVIARIVTAQGQDNAIEGFGRRSRHAPILVRASHPDVPGRPRPRAPGAGHRGVS